MWLLILHVDIVYSVVVQLVGMEENGEAGVEYRWKGRANPEEQEVQWSDSCQSFSQSILEPNDNDTNIVTAASVQGFPRQILGHVSADNGPVVVSISSST